MNSILAKINRALTRLRDWYYRRKYSLTARLVGKSGAYADLSQKGLLLIQLDALPYETFCAAMERGYMPFLRKELLAKRFDLRRWYSGVPSNTPSVQAAVLYGNNDDIPSFRWFEKKNNLYITFKNPLSAGIVENRLNQRSNDGLLRQGSSYSNMFSGQADTAVATYGSYTQTDLAKTLRSLHLIALIAINLVTVLRTIYYTIKEFVIEIYDWFSMLRHKLIQRSEHLFPLFRILMNVWVREIITVGAMTDLARGTPAIHLTYLAYDELAHQRGPFTRSALNALKTLDRRIRRVVRLAQRGVLRDYDIFIFSDHGTAASMPFFFLYGQTLEQFVSDLVNNPVMNHEQGAGESQVTYAKVLALRLEYWERELVRTISWPVKMFRRILLKRLKETEKEPQMAEENIEVRVGISGPLAHIYMPPVAQLHEQQINQRYPKLVESLLEHKGIGVVVTRSDNEIIIRSKTGTAIVGEEGRPNHVQGEPLPRIEPKPQAYRGLRRLMDMSNSGDIVVLGADMGKYVVNFEEQMAAHGGLGPLQNSPFLMHQPEYRWIPEVDDALQLHEIFKQVRTQKHTDTGKEQMKEKALSG